MNQPLPGPKPTENQPGPTSTTLNIPISNSNALHPNIPSFWSEQVEPWFAIVENQFFIHNIQTDDEKYAHTLGALPKATILVIMDIINTLTPGNKYQSLKTALINRTRFSERQRVEQLLADCQSMGELKPSSFYQLIKQKACSLPSVNPELIKSIWLQRLPYELSAILASDSKKDITEIADKIWAFAKSGNACLGKTRKRLLPPAGVCHYHTHIGVRTPPQSTKPYSDRPVTANNTGSYFKCSRLPYSVVDTTNDGITCISKVELLSPTHNAKMQ